MPCRIALFSDSVKMLLEGYKVTWAVRNRNVRPMPVHTVNPLGSRVESTLVVYTGDGNALRVVQQLL
jgi:hypothetical protein